MNAKAIVYFASIILLTCLTGCLPITESTGNNIQKSDKKIPNEFEKTVVMLDNIKGYRMSYFGGYDMDDKQVVLFSDRNSNAVVWNADRSGKTRVVNKSILPNEFILSYFSKGKFNDIDTIFITQEEDARATFGLLVHEGYHFYGQEWLNDIEASISIPRGTIYPENIDARYLMRASDQRLREKIEGVNGDGDREALFFFQQAVEKYPGDIGENLVTALAEGTANFAEHLFLAVANTPSIKHDKIAVAKAAYRENKLNTVSVDLDKAYEYYQIASLPLYYLATKNKEALLETVLEGKHPLSLLQHMVSQKKSQDIIDLKFQVENYSTEKNEIARRQIKAYQEKQGNEKYALVKIKQSMFSGSIDFEEFINFKVSNIYRTLNVNTTVNTRTETGGIIELRSVNTMDSLDQEFFLIYVPIKSIKEHERKLNINLDTVVIKNVYFEKERKVYIINE